MFLVILAACLLLKLMISSKHNNTTFVCFGLNKLQCSDMRYLVKPSMPRAGIDRKTSDGSNESMISSQVCRVTLDKPVFEHSHCQQNIYNQVKPSLHSRYYAETSKWPIIVAKRLRNTAPKNRRSGGKQLATL